METPTIDLQKLLAGERQTLMYPERLQEIKRRTGNSATESYQLADEALTLLSERDSLAARIADLEAENEKLRAAICWIEPPFIDAKTTESELRKRIDFCVQDAKRAAYKGDQQC